MSNSAKKSEERAEMPEQAEVIDLGAAPNWTSPEQSMAVKQEDGRIWSFGVKHEVDESPLAFNNTFDYPIVIDDDDEDVLPTVNTETPNSSAVILQDSIASGSNTASGEDKEQIRCSHDAMDLDAPSQVPEPQAANATDTGSATDSSNGANNPTSPKTDDGAKIVYNKTMSTHRVSTVASREQLKKAQQAHAKRIAERKQAAAKQAATSSTVEMSNVKSIPVSDAASLPEKKKSSNKKSEIVQLSDTKAGPSRLKAAGKKRAPIAGELDIDSGDNADVVHESESDEGLFVPHNRTLSEDEGGDDDDIDMEEDDEVQKARAEREFDKLTKHFNSELRRFKKNKQKGTLSMEEEIKFIQLENSYKAAVRKREEDDAREKDAAADNTRIQNHGDDDLSDLELFTTFERRREESPSFEIASDDENDPLRAYDRVARAKLHGSGRGNRSGRQKIAGDDSGDELVGGRKRTSGRAQGKKRMEPGKPRKRGSGKNSNDQVQDQNAKVSKSNNGKKSKKKKPASVGTSMLDVGSLWTSNVIQDARGNEGLGSLPSLKATRRDNALKQLIASIPQDKRAEARTDKRALMEAMRDFGTRRTVSVRPGKDGGYLVKGMVSALKAHQLLGAAFMRRRERDTVEPHGGICADQMGFGKTVMMIANILDGMPSKGHEGPKTTLIVATSALVYQWASEIAKHTKGKKNGKPALKVLIHNAKNKISTNDIPQSMAAYHVILTTYDEVRKSYPKAECPIELQSAEERQRWWKDYYEQHRGVLHQVQFLRVVLDEAQYIKNYKSHTSIACRGLEAKHRWALSGTPIQNAVQELYPYFKFLRVPHTGSFELFCRNFVGSEVRPCKLGIDRLNQLLGRFMIRRTHVDKVMGMPMVVLPRATEQIRWVKFNDVERNIYEIVRSRMIKRINKLSRSRELDNNYSHVLTMLLRLRQLTGHILMVENTMRDLLEREDLEKIYDLALVEGSSSKDNLRENQLKRVRTLIAKGTKIDLHHPSRTNFPGVDERKARRRDSLALDYDEDDAIDVELLPDRDNIGGKHGLQYDFLKYLETLRESNQIRELNDRTTCVVCGDKPDDARVTACYHVYCFSCLETIMNEAAEAGEDQARCKECGILFSNSRPCDNLDFGKLDRMRRNGVPLDSLDDESDSEVEMRKKNRKWKSSGGGSLFKKGRGKEKEKKADWIDQEGKNILPSAKTIEIKAQILNWIAENPKVKIIVFTQFIDMIRILEKVCAAEGWPFTIYHGGMSMTVRHENIERFQDQSQIRVLLMSLKSGGIGLNLTMAQKVIVVDPWWNSCVEQQAFCRVFRIGQAHETALTRFVVEQTVDQNMIEMQQRKQAEIDRVMDRKGSKRLDVQELLKLFGGEVGENEDGQPFIFAENENVNTRPNPLADDEDGLDQD